MSRVVTSSLVAALAAIALAAPLTAQRRSTVDAVAMNAAVVSRTVNSRSIVTSALTSTNSLAVAASMGLSPDDLANRIASLDDASAKKVADQILAGGDERIVISTTAVIIALLLIILLTR